MKLFQRAEEKVFKWRKAVNETRPRCLQDVHLEKTVSNESITRLVYNERRRVAKQDTQRKKQAAKRAKQEGRTYFRETLKLIDDAFDGTIAWGEYEIREDDALHADCEVVKQQLSDIRNRAKAKVDGAKEGVRKGCDKVAEIIQRTSEKVAEKAQKVAEKMERRKIAKEAKEAKCLTDIEIWTREIKKGRLNEDYWDEEKWDEEKRDEEKRDICVEHVEYA
ncbi:hypothetical protein EAE96_002281 [Botrytis aclada]|nr:hypothetical protein EAE96_002281 [Botrytis aclada]